MPELPSFDFIQIGDAGPLGVRELFGTSMANGEPSTSTEQRRSRCFELCSYAILFGDAPDSARLVHGSWHGPNAPQRIRHAWLELPGDMIWEPIFAAVFTPDLRDYAQMWDERTYSRDAARRLALSSGHYGPWHESRYP